MRAREVFEDKLSKHFLSTMFRGMGDYPPPFATEKPRVFDDKLPKISLQVGRQLLAALVQLFAMKYGDIL
jgi:hypothetical protein